VPQARLTLEQQISTVVTVTYITNLSVTNQQIVRVQWDVSKQWSVVALRDENGAFSIDFSTGGDSGRRPLRLRKVQNRLKVEHSIIGGLRDVLERLLEANSSIRSVIPGVIRPVRDAKGDVKIRVTVPITNGWKAIALSAGRAPGAVHQPPV